MSAGKGLIGALTYFGLPAMDTESKSQMRELALQGGPYTEAEKQSLLNYCEEDVLAVEQLFNKMNA